MQSMSHLPFLHIGGSIASLIPRSIISIICGESAAIFYRPLMMAESDAKAVRLTTMRRGAGDP